MRLFYFAPISNTRMDRELGYQLDVPSARNKVLGVCGAVRQQGVFPVVVTSIAPPLSPMRAFSKTRTLSIGWSVRGPGLFFGTWDY